MLWFPVDKQVRNDWRIKSVRRKFGAAGVGRLLMLWSYVATEGSQTDEGRGVQRDGSPLDLHGMAEDCDFVDADGRPDLDAFRAFLEHLADVGHIDPSDWHERGIVFLPAMNRRLEAYRASKGRATDPTAIKRGRGRPKGSKTRPRNSPEIAGEFPQSQPPISAGNSSEIQAGPVEIPKDSGDSGNSGESRAIPGNSGQTKVPCITTSGSGSTLNEQTDQDDDPKVPKPQALVDLWNRVRDPGPKVLQLTDQRKDRYRRALKARPNLADWEAAIRYLNGASWANACGEGTHANFRADLDYLAKPGNVVKALERLAAQNLPGRRTGAAAGRVAPATSRDEAVKARQAAEDEDLRSRGLL